MILEKLRDEIDALYAPSRFTFKVDGSQVENNLFQSNLLSRGFEKSTHIISKPNNEVDIDDKHSQFVQNLDVYSEEKQSTESTHSTQGDFNSNRRVATPPGATATVPIVSTNSLSSSAKSSVIAALSFDSSGVKSGLSCDNSGDFEVDPSPSFVRRPVWNTPAQMQTFEMTGRTQPAASQHSQQRFTGGRDGLVRAVDNLCNSNT